MPMVQSDGPSPSPTQHPRLKMEAPAVRVLVVGDSGVGKTTLLQGICRDGSAGDVKPHRWTIGCDVHVLSYQYRDQYGTTKDMYIEFVDVGGHTKYDISRGMFYNDVQGIVLVHDLGNAKSYDHLRLWLAEINDIQRRKGCVLPAPYNQRSTEYPSLSSMPKLVIGNKRDTVSIHTKRPVQLPELRGYDSLEASAEPYSLDVNVLYGFLDRVVSFANSQGFSGDDGGVGGDYNSSFSSGYSDGLRQTKTRQLSPTIASTPSTTGSSGWWR